MAKLDYDPEVIVRKAQRLYATASWITFAYVFVPVVLALISGYILKPGLLIAPIVGMLGWQVGRWRSEWLRVQAQRLLCEVMVEAHTREAARVLRESAFQHGAQRPI